MANVGAIHDDHDGEDNKVVVVGGRKKSEVKRILSATPGFFYILLLYVAGYFIFKDARSVLFSLGNYHFSWVEVLLTAAAMMAIAEQLRVSHAGVDNTFEAIGMAIMAVVQLVLFILGAAEVSIKGYQVFKIFSNTEFVTLTLISGVQAIVAIVINARTLKRTITQAGDN